MQARRLALPLGMAAVLSSAVAVSVATGPTHPGATVDAPAYRGPVATISGGAAGPAVYPAVVSVHLDRSEAALDRGEAAVDRGKPAAAAPEVQTAGAQMAAAWRATKYVIKTTPAPAPVGDRAGASGAGGGGVSYADPPTTALAVLTLQHDIVASAAGMLGADGTLNNTLLSAIRSTAAVRDAAIKYVHKIEPPAPPGDGRAGVSGGAIAATFASVMPGELAVLDDEIQALKGAVAMQKKTLPAEVVAAVQAVVKQDKATKATINDYWPPVPGDG